LGPTDTAGDVGLAGGDVGLAGGDVGLAGGDVDRRLDRAAAVGLLLDAY
jgi:hypothetical protein